MGADGRYGIAVAEKKGLGRTGRRGMGKKERVERGWEIRGQVSRKGRNVRMAPRSSFFKLGTSANFKPQRYRNTKCIQRQTKINYFNNHFQHLWPTQTDK
jgi:hypothetical protein